MEERPFGVAVRWWVWIIFNWWWYIECGYYAGVFYGLAIHDMHSSCVLGLLYSNYWMGYIRSGIHPAQ